MALTPRQERIKTRRRRSAQPSRLLLELLEDRTVPAQAIPVGPDLSLTGPGPNTGDHIGNSLYFLAHQSTDAPGVSEIWQVNGTATAQELNVPALSGMALGEIASVNGTLFVTAAPVATNATPNAFNVWKIDPTVQGGATELTSFTSTGAADLQVVGNKLVFLEASNTGLISNQSGGNLWVTDGTSAGTTSIFTFTGDAHPNFMASAVAGSDLYFQVTSFTTPTPPALWVTDGTTAGTQAVAVTGGGAMPSLSGSSLTASGNAVFFLASDTKSDSLWMVQGAQASIVQSFSVGPNTAFAPFGNGITAANGNVYFALNTDTTDQIWSSDGTSAGTTLLYQSAANPPTGTGSPGTTPYIGSIAVMNGNVYFNIVNGSGLMEADGQGGTTPVPLPVGLSGFPYLSAVNGRLYFMADDGVHGTELWSTDGTAGGAVRMTDINPGSGSSFPIGPEAAGTGLYVVASDGIPSGQTTFAAEQLWLLPDPSAPAGAAATTTLSTSPPTVTTGGPITITATVVANDPAQPAPTGQVVFRDDLQIYGTAPLVNGTATLATSITVPGSHNLEAVYTGDSVFDESVSQTVPVTAGPSATTLALTTSDATADPGESITFTATIMPSGSAAMPPSGSVTFFDGTNFLGTGFLNDGVATYQTSSLAAGAHTIAAVYSGDTNYSPSSSAPLAETVGPTFTVGLTTTQSSLSLGQQVTLTAQLTPAAGTTLPPGLSVLFRDAATPLGSASVNANGVATLTLSNLGVGAHSLTAAVFNGNNEFDSPATPVTVKQAATASVLHSTAPTARLGQSLTFTMTISTPAGLPAPTGMATFTDGASTLGTAPVANGRAALLVPSLALGIHPITAKYSGDANYNGSSATLSQAVSPTIVATTIAITPHVTSAILGTQVALSATIVPAVGTSTPNGTVTFRDNGALLGSVPIDPTGHALLLTNSLGMGTHSITATFGGSDIFTGSTSAPMMLSVRLGATAHLTSSAGSIVAGQSVTLSATVGAAAGGAVLPAGNVTFYEGTVALGLAPLQNGVAKLTTAPLMSVGVQKITAIYSGNPLFATSSSGTVYVTVRADGTSVTLLTPAAPAAGTGMVTVTASVAVTPPGGGAATGKVTFLDGSTTIGSATVVAGKATLQVPKLAAGSHYLRAVFTGTGDYANSSSSVIRYTIAATTSTTLQAQPAAFGQKTILKATVSILSPGFSKASGKVMFLDGSTVLGTAVLQNGVATFPVMLPVGSHSLKATFEGTSDLAASASAPVADHIGKAAPAVTLTATPAQPKAGSNVTLRADVDPATPGALAPTGNVLFMDGATIIGSGTISHGMVSLATTKLSKGTQKLTAMYGGDGDYLTAVASLSLTLS